jgi:glucokinase
MPTTRDKRRAERGVLLAADVGGTKALVALFDGGEALFERRYECADFASFDAVLERFRADARAALGVLPNIDCASVGVAGPVSGDRVRLTNRAWEIDRRRLGAPRACLLNDFEASARGLDSLAAHDLETLQAGAPLPGATRVLLGAGTGLGVAILVGSGAGLQVLAGEGGHLPFAPADEMQAALWRQLRATLGRVELEHVLSGAGLVRIHGFLRAAVGKSTGPGPADAVDPTPAAISKAALESRDALALAALDLFIACYGAAAGDFALAVLARGGVYVAGGIAPKILPRMRAGGFLAAYNAKGAFSDAVRACPVHVITNERVGLLGAVAAAPP